jgi:CO/xanthine dehydrogenase Mo-binding subunit
VNKLIERSCRAIQKKRFRESLPIVAKAQTRISRDSALSSGASLGGLLFDSASWCGTAVEIEIDRLSGEPQPIAVWMVIDAGRIVKRELALSSLRSSIISALNLCISRDFDPEKSEGQYLSHGQLRFANLPFIGIDFMDSERTTVSKGLGELPFLTIPAAFHSALTQALGVEPRQLPLSGSEILRLLESQ